MSEIIMPSKVSIRADNSLDSEVVSILLAKCQTPIQVINMGRELGHKYGWREEFALYGEAAKKFPEYETLFLRKQQTMATLGKIRTYAEMERSGMLKRPDRKKLLRTEVGVKA